MPPAIHLHCTAVLDGFCSAALYATTSFQLHFRVRFLLAFIQAGVIAGVVPGHHEVLHAIVLHCEVVSMRVFR